MDKYNILFKKLEINSGCHEKGQLHQAGEKNQSAPKTASELATHWHSRGPQAKSCIGKVPFQTAGEKTVGEKYSAKKAPS